MELKELGKKELADYLAANVELFRRLPKPDRDRLVSMAQVLIARNFPEEFVLSGISSTAAVMEDLQPDPGDIMQSEHVQRFIRENATSHRRMASRPVKEAKRMEREQFLEAISMTLREARSVKTPHEIKKMRKILLGIDQRNMRQVLGRDADEPIRQIRSLLNQWAPLFSNSH